MSWIQGAALHVNPKLRGSVRGQSVALHAVTRIDLSANSLNFIPLELFQMISLRYVLLFNIIIKIFMVKQSFSMLFVDRKKFTPILFFNVQKY